MKKFMIPIVFLFIACTNNQDDWIVLFNGDDISHWREYNKTEFPFDGWAIENGILKTIVGGNRVDIITRELYKDFEFVLEWKASPAGNSGIFYFATEKGDYIWQTAPEMQVLDNDRHPDGKNPLTSAGSLFALIAPNKDVSKKVGEFNEARIVAKKNHIEHWLNGKKILEYDYNSDSIKDLISKSKFASMPLFAKENIGHIGLQHHGEEIWYRNIRIRKL
ncbi:MAG: DUF1080 domain-containing protein [Candidatus Marinimicrobia bacterium]|jgi:hypothetical protein|nr:DUF1080 domain-containing protein [Candidatus Neomarinimicrobiota bacterium]